MVRRCAGLRETDQISGRLTDNEEQGSAGSAQIDDTALANGTATEAGLTRRHAVRIENEHFGGSGAAARQQRRTAGAAAATCSDLDDTHAPLVCVRCCH
jgi:hypothetical protein